MAEFGIQAANLSAPQRAGSQPVGPVYTRQDYVQSPLIGLAGLGIQAGMMYAQSKQKSAANAFLSSYQKDLAGIADALQGGQITEREALTRTNAISNNYIANAPADGGEMLKAMAGARKDVFSMTSLQFAEQDHEDNRALIKEAKSKATQEGLLAPLGPNRSAASDAAAVALSQSLQRAEDEQSRLIKAASEGRAAESHIWTGDRVQRENAEYLDKKAAQSALSDVKNSAVKYLTESVGDLIEQVKTGTMSFEDAQLSAQQISSTLAGQAQQVLIASPESAQVVTGQIQELTKAALAYMDPKSRGENTKAIYDDMLTRTKIVLTTSDPRLQTLAATNSMIPNLPIEATVSNTSIMKAFDAADKGTLPGIVMNNDTDTQRTIYQGVLATVNKAKVGGQGGKPVAQMSDAGKMADAVNREVARVVPGDPVQLRTFTQFVASPEYGQLVKDGVVDKQTSVMAHTALVNTHQREVLMNVTPKLNAPLGETIVRDGVKTQPTLAQVVDFEMRGGELIMVPKTSVQVYAAKQYINAKTRETENAVREINTLIKAGAHLDGTTDYAAYWEKNKHVIMPDFYIAPEREAEARKQGYLGGNRRNPANWRKPESVGTESVGQ